MKKTFEEIAEMYKDGNGITAIEKKTGIGRHVVKKILITKGLIKTEEADLYARGCWTIEEIAEHLGKSANAVSHNLPYEKVPTEEDIKKTKENVKGYVKPGWHHVCGCDIYVEDGCIVRGKSADGQKTTYPYRKCRSGGWDIATGISVGAFRLGVQRGTIDMK